MSYLRKLWDQRKHVTRERLLMAWIVVFTALTIAALDGERSNEHSFKSGVVKGCSKVLTVQRKIIKAALDDHPKDGKLLRLQKDYKLANPAQCKDLIYNKTK